jgi:RNA polymerase sigma-70 factor (ECF subfamily)
MTPMSVMTDPSAGCWPAMGRLAPFFSANFARLYRFALARTDGDADAAEEAVQKSLIVAMRKLHTFRGEATLFTWLCAICRHEISAWRMAKGRQSAFILSEDAPEVRDRLAAIASIAAEGPDETFTRNETARLVQVALDLLPGAYSDVLEWKYIYGLTVAISERSRQDPKPEPCRPAPARPFEKCSWCW